MNRGQFKKGQNRGDKNNKWLADSVGYDALHDWVKRELGTPLSCSMCLFTSKNSRQFNWANISGKYRRDIKDWVRLCRKCHFAFDNGFETSFARWVNKPVRKIMTNNKSGFKNVRITAEGRFRAYITIEHKQHSIGNFDTAELAYAAYKQKALELYDTY